MHYIYTLAHPITGEIRYVGKTIDPKTRFRDHCATQKKYHSSCWIKSLKNKGLLPVMEILDEIENDWQFWERYWVSQFKTWGFRLTNHKDGGTDNHYGNKTSFKTNQRLIPIVAFNLKGEKVGEFASTVVANELTNTDKSSISACLTKRKKTANNLIWIRKTDYELMNDLSFITYINWCNSIKEHSNESRKEQSNKLKGIKKSDEHIKKCVESRLNNGNNKHTPETKQKLSDKNKGILPPNALKIISIDESNNIIEYLSIRQASLLSGIKNLAYYLDKNRKDKSGKKWFRE